MNKVILTGNLTRDPELSQTASGISMCRMSVAVNRPFTNQDGEREVDFFNITAWRAQAENCGKYLSKGKKVGIVGRMQTRTYEKDGVKCYATDIIAEEVEFLSPRSNEAQEPNQGGKKSIRDGEPIYDEDLPF